LEMGKIIDVRRVIATAAFREAKKVISLQIL